MSRERTLREMTAASSAEARHAVETRLRAITADIADLERTRRWINVAVWGIALGVMIYGAINVTALLIDHGVWVQVAWLLSVMIDLAMCVALMGDRVLHRYGRRDGWVTALRWLTAVMTLVLNTTRPALAHDWVGVGIHTAGPVLLMLVAEGASSFQRQLAAIIRDLQTELRELAEATDYRDETGHVAAGVNGARPTVSTLIHGRDAGLALVDAGLAASRPKPVEKPTPTPPIVGRISGADPHPDESTTTIGGPAATEVAETDHQTPPAAYSRTLDHSSGKHAGPRRFANRPRRPNASGRETTRRESMLMALPENPHFC